MNDMISENDLGKDITAKDVLLQRPLFVLHHPHMKYHAFLHLFIH